MLLFAKKWGCGKGCGKCGKLSSANGKPVFASNGQKEFVQFFGKKSHRRGCCNYVLRKQKMPIRSSCFLMKKLDFSENASPKNGNNKIQDIFFGEIYKAFPGIIRLQMEILESKPRGGTPCREK